MITLFNIWFTLSLLNFFIIILLLKYNNDGRRFEPSEYSGADWLVLMMIAAVLPIGWLVILSLISMKQVNKE